MADEAAVLAQRSRLWTTAEVAGHKVKLATRAGSGRVDAAATALTLRPGQTGTLNVTITPTGKWGAVVEGDLFIDTFDLDLVQGDELASISYTYKTK